MKIIYTNISPVTNAYTNINHIYYLKKQNPKKVYLCIWDNFVFEHPTFEKDLDYKTNKLQKLNENVEVLEKLMNHLGIDYKIIFLSEAMDRFLKNSKFSSTFHKILSYFKVEDLTKGGKIEYIPFSRISLSKINYIILDYLIAMNLPELFPELCSTAPNQYLTSERFKVFHEKIEDYLSSSYIKYSSPKPIFVKKVPVIISSEDEIPSMNMSYEKIKLIVENYFKDKKISKTEIQDLILILEEVLGKLKNNKKKRNEIIAEISKYLNDYFIKIQKIVQKENIKDRTKSLFISEKSLFEKNIKPLNSIKLEILKFCDGTNTSLDISRKTGINLSTISTYFNFLRKQELISGNKKPKRVVDNIIINLRDMT